MSVCVLLPPDTLSLQSLKKSLGIQGDTRASSREVDRLEPGHGCCLHTCSPERKKESRNGEQPGAAPGRMAVEPRRRWSCLETEEQKELQTGVGPRGACPILLYQEGGRSPQHRGCCQGLLSCLKNTDLGGT